MWYALLAQLDRVFGYEPKGCRFNSCTARFYEGRTAVDNGRVVVGLLPRSVCGARNNDNAVILIAVVVMLSTSLVLITDVKMCDIDFLKIAIKEAKKAEAKNEVPVGCVIVREGRVIARAHNLTIIKKDPSAHAEVLAIRKAAKKIGNYRLTNCVMYVTIEPCPMCAGAAVWARLKEIVFGAYDERAGACGSVVNIANNKKLNHHIKIKGGVLSNECADLIKSFFRNRRANC